MSEPKLLSDKLIAELDAALKVHKPKGILVNLELFYFLKDRGRISDVFIGLPGISMHLLDKKTWITASDLPYGESFRLPPESL